MIWLKPRSGNRAGPGSILMIYSAGLVGQYCADLRLTCGAWRNTCEHEVGGQFKPDPVGARAACRSTEFAGDSEQDTDWLL